jgi:hypothetical protein
VDFGFGLVLLTVLCGADFAVDFACELGDAVALVGTAVTDITLLPVLPFRSTTINVTEAVPGSGLGLGAAPAELVDLCFGGLTLTS